MIAAGGAPARAAPEGGANDDPNAETTITFWHGWSAPSEVKAIQANVDAFEDGAPEHPRQGRRQHHRRQDQPGAAGRWRQRARRGLVVHHRQRRAVLLVGRRSSTSTRSSTKAGIDPETTFPSAMLDYTQFEGNRCTLPLLGDAYGLYYNKDTFDAAGISGPPKTLSEFDADAIKLTKSNGDSYYAARLHAELPRLRDHDRRTSRRMWNPTYFDDRGKSTVDTDPAFKAVVRVAEAAGRQARRLRQAGEVPDHLRRRVRRQEPLPDRPGGDGARRRVAGRLGRRRQRRTSTTASRPFPVPDDQADTYGKGYLSGTIIGIASTEREAERGLGAGQVPDHRHRGGGELRQRDPQRPVDAGRAQVTRPRPEPRRSTTFIGIAQNPNSNTTPASPNGGAYQLTLQDLGLRLRVRQGDRPAGGARRGCRRRSTPTSTRRSDGRVDRRSTGGRPLAARPARAAPGAAATAAQPRLPLAVADRHRSVLHLPAGLDRLLLLHPLRRVHDSGVDRARQLAVRVPGLPVLLAGAAQHRCGWSS